MTYRMPNEVVEAECREWRTLFDYDSARDVAMSCVDKLAKQEGLVDEDGYGLDGEIEMAYTEYSGWAERWFRENPREVTA